MEFGVRHLSLYIGILIQLGFTRISEVPKERYLNQERIVDWVLVVEKVSNCQGFQIHMEATVAPHYGST